MIVNTASFKRDRFLTEVSARIAPGHDGHFTSVSTDPESGHEEIYLAGGYWRGYYCPDGMLSLINPDRTREEIIRVEQGLAVLLRCEFRIEQFRAAPCPDCTHKEG